MLETYCYSCQISSEGRAEILESRHGKIVPVPQNWRERQSSWSLLKLARTWPSVMGTLTRCQSNAKNVSHS